MGVDIDSHYPMSVDRHVEELEKRVRHLEREVYRLLVGGSIFMMSMLTIVGVYESRLNKVEKVQNLKDSGNAANQKEKVAYHRPHLDK